MLPPNPWELSWCLPGEHFRRGPVVGCLSLLLLCFPELSPFPLDDPSRTVDLQGAGMGLRFPLPSDSPKSLKAKFGGRDEAGRGKETTLVPPSKILPILPGFFTWSSLSP